MNQGSTKRIKLSEEKVDLFVFEDNIFTDIVSFLHPTDIVNVGLTCSGFGSVRDGQPSLANEAASRMFRSAATEYETIALPRYNDESAIAWLRQLDLLRERLEFGQLIGQDINYTSAETKSSVTLEDSYFNSALSNHVMRRGTHRAIFNISDEADDFWIHVGITRPLERWDEKELDFDRFFPVQVYSSDDISRDLLAGRTDRWGTSDVNCCSYSCDDGYCSWSNWTNCGCEEWEGQESLREDGTIGLLLDLDEGTLTVYQNGRRLGVMKSRLSGEYCWFTSITSSGDSYGSSSTVSIERDTLP